MATEITEETTESNERSECVSNAYHVSFFFRLLNKTEFLQYKISVGEMYSIL